MNPVMKNGYLTDLDTNTIIDTRLDDETCVCRHCKKNNQHIVVNGTKRWGYGLDQIMAFFKCPVCCSEWYYDIGRHRNHERLVGLGIVDGKTGRLSDKFKDDCKQIARKITQDILGTSNHTYVQDSLEYLRKNFKIRR
jgi:hypothetical protein